MSQCCVALLWQSGYGVEDESLAVANSIERFAGHELVPVVLALGTHRDPLVMGCTHAIR